VKRSHYTLACTSEEAAEAAYSLLRTGRMSNVFLALQLRRQIDQAPERRMDRVAPPPTTVPAAGAPGEQP
jgi:hypothetical protein